MKSFRNNLMISQRNLVAKLKKSKIFKLNSLLQRKKILHFKRKSRSSLNQQEKLPL